MGRTPRVSCSLCSRAKDLGKLRLQEYGVQVLFRYDGTSRKTHLKALWKKILEHFKSFAYVCAWKIIALTERKHMEFYAFIMVLYPKLLLLLHNLGRLYNPRRERGFEGV